MRPHRTILTLVLVAMLGSATLAHAVFHHTASATSGVAVGQADIDVALAADLAMTGPGDVTEVRFDLSVPDAYNDGDLIETVTATIDLWGTNTCATTHHEPVMVPDPEDPEGPPIPAPYECSNPNAALGDGIAPRFALIACPNGTINAGACSTGDFLLVNPVTTAHDAELTIRPHYLGAVEVVHGADGPVTFAAQTIQMLACLDVGHEAGRDYENLTGHLDTTWSFGLRPGIAHPTDRSTGPASTDPAWRVSGCAEALTSTNTGSPAR